MIAITAAAGMTGRHVLRALSSAGFAVRAIAHSAAGAETARTNGARDAVVADLTHPN